MLAVPATPTALNTGQFGIFRSCVAMVIHPDDVYINMVRATNSHEESTVRTGEPVFDRSGDRIGHVHSVDDDGFYVSHGDRALHDRVTRGQDELVWRCLDCGAMGRIDEIPEGCPDCGAPREDLYYWTED